jgi:hypothetical protein
MWFVNQFITCGVRRFENRVVRKILGSERAEVTGGRGRLHRYEFHDLYSSPYI